MAQKSIREFDIKRLLSKYWNKYIGADLIYTGYFLQVGPNSDIEKIVEQNPWLLTEKLVIKPDQLVGKRGKHGLIKIDAKFMEIKTWLKENRDREVIIHKARDKLNYFIIEPYVPHKIEYYLAIKSERYTDHIYFSTTGGIDIEQNWGNVVTISINILERIDQVDITSKLPTELTDDQKKIITKLIKGIYNFYVDMNFTFLEFNPILIQGNKIIPCDAKARLDDTAYFECSALWGDTPFPPPFGRSLIKEEEYIKNLDERTGASLKLTVLNPEGRIWTIVAGGGASIIYADTIVNMGYEKELANYGEYSGDPSTEFTYYYAKTILDLMTRIKHPKGKILIIGGGIANFTDIAETFTGIIQALVEYKDKLIDNNIRIYVRRGGPNYQEGLNKMKMVSKTLGVPMEVYGPETHMTRIVSLALKK